MQNLHYNIFRSFLKYFCINILSKFFIKVTLYWHLVNDTLVLSFIFVYFQYVYVYFVSFLTFFLCISYAKNGQTKKGRQILFKSACGLLVLNSYFCASNIRSCVIFSIDSTQQYSYRP